MSDERLREAERRWRETGAVEDEARFLIEQVRLGELTTPRLRLAAYCDHDGAREALAEAARRPGPPQLWIYGLEEWGPQVVARAAVAAAYSVLPLVEKEQPSMAHTPRHHLEVADAWICRGGAPPDSRTNQASWPEGTRPEVIAAACAAHAALRSTGKDGASAAGTALVSALEAAGDESPLVAIRFELVAHALDRADPVRARVDARERASGP
jgi:hypothetical protein